MSRKSRESSSAETDRVIQEPLSCAPVKAEQSGLTQMATLPHAVLEHDSPHSSSSTGTKNTPKTRKRTVASIVHAEVNSIGSGDNIYFNTMIATARKPSENPSEDKSLVLEHDRCASSRRGSQASSLYPYSPRPGSRSSRRSSRSSRRRRSSKEGVRRGELLIEMARNDSVRSRESRRSVRDGMRDRNFSSRKRKNSAASTTSSSCSSISRRSGIGAALTSKGRRGYMTAQEAVALGEKLCGCVLKARVIYFIKPLIFIAVGSILMLGGVALTVLHFMYEDVIDGKGNPPYFTWGPITLSTGVILFMVGLVWLPIKEQKWKDGTASPMLRALEKWHEDKAKKYELQMEVLGEIKVSSSMEKVNETTFNTGERKSERTKEYCDGAHELSSVKLENEQIV